jgi:16S rRNA (guanine1207-N2)-methyltransferase
MTRWAEDPEGAADALVARATDRLGLAGRLLLIEQYGQLPRTLAAAGHDVCVWNRRVGDWTATVAPPPGPFNVALLRLPKAKAELEMASEMALGVLVPGGCLYIYGGNDEGMRSVAGRLDSRGLAAETIAAEGHGRILLIPRPEAMDGRQRRLEDWVEPGVLRIDGTLRPWVSYPGLFAAGTLDAGTALLLSHLPALPRGAHVLDYGTGTGPIAATLAARHPDARIDLLDADAVALDAARRNVTGGHAILGDGLAATAGRRYDLIASNPPLHVGIAESHVALERLIAEAPAHLAANGRLVMVVQRRVGLGRALASVFQSVDVVADDGRYRVWSAGEIAGRKIP